MKKFGFYRPAIACFLMMMATSLQATGLGFFVTPVSEALGVGRSSVALFYSLLSGMGALGGPTLGKLVGKRGLRPVLICSGVLSCAGLWMVSMANGLWVFYLTAILMGATASGGMMLCANVGLQRSYDSSTVSSFLGIVMAGSGFGGMIISALLPGLIEAQGWRFGYRFMGCTWLVLAVLALLMLGKEKQAGASAGAAVKQALEGMTQAEAKRSPKLYLVAAQGFVLAAACGVLQHLPSVLGGMGFETGKVSALMSLMTAMLALGKIGQGILCSKAGVPIGGAVVIVMFIVSFPMLTQPALIYPTLVLLAVGIGAYTTLMPLITRCVFGSYDFAAIWGIVQACGSAGVFVGAPLWGMAFDVAGSYLPAMIVTPVLLVASLAIHWILFREK